MTSWRQNLRSRSLAARGAILGVVVIGLAAAVAPVAGLWHGPAGLGAVAVAAGVCLLGALTALAIAHVLRAPRHALWGVLLGMAVRMGVPLACGLVFHLRGGALVDAGLLYYLLMFYPVTLGVETVLSLPGDGSAARCSDLSQDV